MPKAIDRSYGQSRGAQGVPGAPGTIGTPSVLLMLKSLKASTQFIDLLMRKAGTRLTPADKVYFSERSEKSLLVFFRRC